MENNEKSKYAKIAITISIVIVAIIVFFIGIFLTKSIINEIKHKNEIKEYESKVIEYMNDKYNEELNARLVSEGYKRNIAGLDGSIFYCGHDDNMKEYIFEIKSKDGNRTSYVTLWRNIETGEITINESYGSSYADTTYQLAKNIEKTKEDIEEIVKHYYQNYSITNSVDTSIKGDNNVVTVRIQEVYKKEMDNNCELIQKLIDYLQNKETNVVIGFNRILITINESSNRDIINKYYKYVSEVEEFMKNNYDKKFNIYNINPSDFNITIRINQKFVSTYKSNRELYNRIFNGIKEIIDRYDFDASIDFYDESIKVYKYQTYSLDEIYNKSIKK